MSWPTDSLELRFIGGFLLAVGALAALVALVQNRRVIREVWVTAAVWLLTIVAIRGAVLLERADKRAQLMNLQQRHRQAARGWNVPTGPMRPVKR